MAIIRSGWPGDPDWEIEFGFPEMDDKVWGPDDLAGLKRQVEEMHRITAINPAARAIVLRYWPDLAAKLPPQGH